MPPDFQEFFKRFGHPDAFAEFFKRFDAPQPQLPEQFNEFIKRFDMPRGPEAAGRFGERARPFGPRHEGRKLEYL